MLRNIGIITAAVLFAGTAEAAAQNSHVRIMTTVCFATSCETAGLRIWDGDTFIVDHTGGASVKIRIENIDAPEIEGRCAYESDLAQQSKNRLAELLSGRITLHPGKLDRYGRQLATIANGGNDVGEILINEKLARRWDGSRHPWCPGT